LAVGSDGIVAQPAALKRNMAASTACQGPKRKADCFIARALLKQGERPALNRTLSCLAI
jgi:hypothetical protein